MKRLIILAILLGIGWTPPFLFSQATESGSATVSGSGAINVAAGLGVGVNCSTDNQTTSSTTVTCGPITPTAGSTLACTVGYYNSATFTSITDNVNSGQYLPAASLMRDNGHHQIGGIYYHENVAGSSTTITLTYSPTEEYGRIACIEIKNTPTAYGADSTFVAGQTGDSNSPTTGSSLTPFGNSRFVYGLTLNEGGTASAGSGYTYLGTQTGQSAYQLLPEYQIQGTATSTNAPQSISATEYWGDQMAAWALPQAGTCGLSTVINWSGGTNGNNPTAADLNSSTHGAGTSQPNADRAYNGNAGTNQAPGWTIAGTEELTYSTSGYAPLQTTRSCPFYSGNGTTANTLGLSWSTSNTPSASDGNDLYFDTSSNIASCWACLMFTGSQVGGDTGDMVIVARSDNSDYNCLQWNGSGWALEAKGGTASLNYTWSANTWYGFLLVYNGTSTSVNHTLSVYSFSSAQCQGTATLLGTVSEASAGKGPPNQLRVSLGEANSTWGSGQYFYLGAIELDVLYGATLAP